MGRHVAGDVPALDRIVDDACACIGREIDALGVPSLAGVVLGGGYGRGEGGVKRACRRGDCVGQPANCECSLSNDLDFFAITEEGAPEAKSVAAIGEAIGPVAKKWTKELGVDVDFAVKTPWRLRHDEERIMVQELVRGYFDVAGTAGEQLFAGIRKVDAADIPWMEAARLLMNRGMGLLFAMPGPAADTRRTPDFINRNINKCILGAGDARLVARHAYAWRAEDRAGALGDSLYAAAVEWKFRPGDDAVCSWDAAREAWLDALDEVKCGSANARSPRQAVRWLVRRRTVGELRTLGLDPVERILDNVARHVRNRRAPDAVLMRDWEIFN